MGSEYGGGGGMGEGSRRDGAGDLGQSQALKGLECHAMYLGWLGLPQQIPQTGWLEQQTFISYSSGPWEVQDQGADETFLLVCRQLSSLCIFTWWKGRER